MRIGLEVLISETEAVSVFAVFSIGKQSKWTIKICTYVYYLYAIFSVAGYCG